MTLAPYTLELPPIAFPVAPGLGGRSLRGNALLIARAAGSAHAR